MAQRLKSLTSVGVTTRQAIEGIAAMSKAMPPLETLCSMRREALLTRYPALKAAPFLVDWYIKWKLHRR